MVGKMGNYSSNFFNSKLSLGKIGENFVKDVSKYWKSVTSVVDVSDNTYYQGIGIDLVFITNSGSSFVDVKTDTYTSGNMAIELTQSQYSKGWFYTTKADCIAYVSLAKKALYWLNVNNLRRYVQELPDTIKTSYTKIARISKAECLCIPYPVLEKEKVITTSLSFTSYPEETKKLNKDYKEYLQCQKKN